MTGQGWIERQRVQDDGVAARMKRGYERDRQMAHTDRGEMRDKERVREWNERERDRIWGSEFYPNYEWTKSILVISNGSCGSEFKSFAWLDRLLAWSYFTCYCVGPIK
jgi:hypothetical protein